MNSLWLVIGIAVGAAPEQTKKVEALIADLESPLFVKREDALWDLIEVGYPAMPALRRARAGNIGPDKRRRLDDIIAAIEKQDPPRTLLHRLADRLQPAGNDALVAGLHVVALSRPISAEEYAQAVRQLGRGRPEDVAALIDRLLSAKDGSRAFLDAQLQMLELKEQLYSSNALLLRRVSDLAKVLGPQIAAVTKEWTDDQELAAAYLVTVGRYPSAAERRQMLRHRLKVADRQLFVSDVVWTLMNSAEFLRDR